MMRRRALAAEAGASLVEVLAAVALMGIAFVSIVGGMMTSAMGSDVHRKAATVDRELRTFADRAALAPYDDCAPAASYAPAAIDYDPPEGYSASVETVAFWDPDDADPSTGAFVSSCTSDPGLQRVTLRLSADDDRADASREILKRRP